MAERIEEVENHLVVALDAMADLTVMFQAATEQLAAIRQQV